jgi:SAM-dependent methyltransferase
MDDQNDCEDSSAPWHQDERFWSTMRDGIFEPHRWAAAEAEVAQLLGLLELQPHAAVLDMPCGPGRHLIHLAARELRVTGVDLTRSYLDEARERLSGAGLSAELIHADMRELLRPASFDAILHLYSSFGYFDDPRDDLRLLRNMRENLRADGSAVLELAVLDGVALDSAQEHVLQNGSSIIESASRRDQNGVLVRDWEASEPGASGMRQRWQAKHRLYRVSELEQLLRSAGFNSIRVFGGFDGGCFVADGGYAVVVARVAAACVARCL